MYLVSFVREGKQTAADAGMTVLEAEIRAGLVPDAPCGGTGKCGKCLVKVREAENIETSALEDRVSQDGKNGSEYMVVRACQMKIAGNLLVDTMVSPEQKKYTILTQGSTRKAAFDPGLKVQKIRLEKPKPGEKRSDWKRLTEALHLVQDCRPNLRIASELYGKRKKSQEWYVVHTEDEILELRMEEGKVYFAAFDIGTTTVVGYLLDARDGKVLAVESCLNPQSQYGADVIMRANYALEHGTETLSRCIRQAVGGLLKKLAERASANQRDIFQVSIVGNTCMHHLFLGISPEALVHAPYTPAISQRLTLPAADYGLTVHPNGRIIFLPNIAGYVGADTCGCLLEVRPDKREEITLMLDIGTNGEMVLGNKERLVTCSTAAGPAFEGAKIQCGMRGAAGAVDHVSFEKGEWSYTTVGNEPAVGLCGSGLIDLTAALLLAGLIDESGRFVNLSESPYNTWRAAGAKDVFVLIPPEKSGNDRGVYLTQKDIQEVQLAKAAIAAGIQMLMRELSVTENDIACVYIAGAFGNYMDPESAGVIGMIPKSLTGKVKPIGNAAGEGAKIALMNRRELRELEELVSRIDFVELAASPDFQDCFVDELFF